MVMIVEGGSIVHFFQTKLFNFGSKVLNLDVFGPSEIQKMNEL